MRVDIRKRIKTIRTLETRKASLGLEMFKTWVQSHQWAGIDPMAWPRGFESCEFRMNTAGLPLEAFSFQARLGSSQSVHRGNSQEWACMSKLQKLPGPAAHGLPIFSSSALRRPKLF